MSRCIALLVLALTFVGACDGNPLPVQRLEPRIINGTADTTDVAVVALVYQGEQFCTGTLIAPRTVVSAGHCLKETGFTASQISVFFGNAVGGAGTSAKVSKWTANPNYYVQSDGAPINDVSVLVLASDAPVAPMAWQSTALGNIVGQSVKMVGYGVTNANQQTGNGTRRQVNETITDQDNTFIYYGGGKSGTCQGDSGGPTFLDVNGTPTVIAVTSYGDQSCVQLGANTRVDTYASFIKQFITGSCTPACGGKSCGSDGCGGTCGSCASAETCDSSGQCVASGGGSGDSTGATCSHDLCTAGAKVTKSCDACAAKICATDSYCCSTAWDAQCVGEVASVCGLSTCGGSSSGGSSSDGSSGNCSHSVCSTGTKLQSGCDSCVSAICGADSYCCTTKWDAQCVQEVAQFCNGSC
jgi:V8-like Glu-specific endopeptidase